MRCTSLGAPQSAVATTPRAGDLLDKSLALYRQHSDLDGMQWSLRGLGHLALDQGDATAAGRFFRESLALAHESGDRLELARSLEGLAGASLDAHPERTVRLAGTAAALREALTAEPFPWEGQRLDRWLGATERILGQVAYTAAWNEGRVMHLAQALALAGADDGPDHALQPPRGSHHPADPLSPREREVARLVAHGCTNRQIAEQLVIAPRTSDTHVTHILTKLKLHSRAELAVWAVEHGLTAKRAD
jgi:DNA-binding CsgD family transcriptional regulator